MDCRQCNDEMTAYMDGELSDEEEKQVRLHLNKCLPCEMEFAELRDSALLVASNTRVLEPAPELWNKLQARITQMPAPGGTFGIFRFLVMNRWAAAIMTMAATAVLAFGLWSYLQYRQSQNDLEIALKEYVQSRTVTERLHHIQLRQAMRIPAVRRAFGSPLLENPFADVRPVSYTNPFRAEER